MLGDLLNLLIMQSRGSYSDHIIFGMGNFAWIFNMAGDKPTFSCWTGLGLLQT